MPRALDVDLYRLAYRRTFNNARRPSSDFGSSVVLGIRLSVGIRAVGMHTLHEARALVNVEYDCYEFWSLLCLGLDPTAATIGTALVFSHFFCRHPILTRPNHEKNSFLLAALESMGR